MPGFARRDRFVRKGKGIPDLEYFIEKVCKNSIKSA
jgi:hypothetical protein